MAELTVRNGPGIRVNRRDIADIPGMSMKASAPVNNP